jgi:Tachylectin
MGGFNLGVVLVRWGAGGPPTGATAHPAWWYQEHFCNADGVGVAGYWSRQTQGEVRLTGDVFDWFDLSATQQELKHPDYNTIERCRVANKAIEQALLRGFDCSGRDGFVVIADITPPTGWSVDRGATPINASVNVGVADIVVEGFGALIPIASDYDFTAHELGHVLGLDHSFGFPQQIATNAVPGEYQHPWCIMSAQVYGESHPQFDPPTPAAVTGGLLDGPLHVHLDRELCNKGPGLNAGTRVGRGWATPIDIDLEPGLDQVFTISSLGAPAGADRYNAITLRAGPDERYVIELRTSRDLDDRGVLCPMIVVNALEGSLADGTYPGKHCASYLGEIQATHRETFVGPGFHVLLEYLSADTRQALVRIRQVTSAIYVPAFLPRRMVSVYACQTDGTLTWYRHNGRDSGRATWLGPRPVGTDWQQFSHIVTGGLGGIIYGIEPNGDLWWYRHDGRLDGTNVWAQPAKVGTGWNIYRTVVATDQRVIYGIDPAGDLWWYRHDGRYAGSTQWIGRVKVGNGWGMYQTVLAASGGVLYGIEPNGDLWWYRHDGYTDGSPQWTGRQKVGNGWNVFASCFTGADGVIYGIEPNGDLWWYRHEGHTDGTTNWTGPKRVGTNWAKFRTVFELDR